MLLLKNLISGRKDWWIMLELQNGDLHDINWAGKPFVGSQLQVDDYTEKLALHAIAQGLPLKEIHVYPIKRAS